MDIIRLEQALQLTRKEGYRIATVYSLNNPNVIRLEPPLTISEEQLDFVADAINEVLSGSKGFLGMAAKSIGTVLDESGFSLLFFSLCSCFT